MAVRRERESTILLLCCAAGSHEMPNGFVSDRQTRRGSLHLDLFSWRPWRLSLHTCNSSMCIVHAHPGHGAAMKSDRVRACRLKKPPLAATLCYKPSTNYNARLGTACANNIIMPLFICAVRCDRDKYVLHAKKSGIIDKCGYGYKFSLQTPRGDRAFAF